MNKNEFGTNHFLWKSIEVGHTVYIEGRDQLGKNRVKEHGATWSIKAIKGLNLLTFAVKTGYKRWIIGPNDKSFIVKAVNTGEMIIGASGRNEDG